MLKKLSKFEHFWCMYDWANSAYATTILAVVLQTYFVATVPDDGLCFKSPNSLCLPADTIWTYSISLSVILVILITPIFGIIADRKNQRVFYLFLFSTLGMISTSLLFFFTSQNYLIGIVFFILSNIGFSGANVFYNSLLPPLSGYDEKKMNSLSSYGFAYGYIGGGLLLGLQLIFFLLAPKLGINISFATRICFLTVGLWWLVFSIPLFTNHKQYKLIQQKNFQQAQKKNIKTPKLEIIKKHKNLILFLVSFLLYNDGVETVIVISAIFGQEELGLGRSTLIGVILMIQFLGSIGTMIWNKISQKIGGKSSILLSLIIWIGIVSYASWGINSEIEFWLLAVCVSFVLGGTQALSRSLFGDIIPKSHEALFYSFFNASGKVSAAMGPFIYGLVRMLGGSIKIAIFSLVIFFILGGILLIFVNPHLHQVNPESDNHGS